MPKVTVNGKVVEVENGSTVIQACEAAGEEIPRFCYHEKLAIAGNCRMCLVEVEKAPKPVASCAYPVMDGMVVHTNTPNVKKAREGVMEFLLINHPLDCPICDQGGECDLQDQAMTYGKGKSRYNEPKRAVKDKYMGPLVKTQMTRCIHCTRCIRFITDIAGVPELGAVHRGEHMEVTTYVEKSISSEVSANIIDLCPVGALTSKPQAFKFRSWELRKIESIDVLDAVGSNIRVDTRGKEVMRILPRTNEEINEEWISDKTRYSYDGLKYQRLDRPMIKDKGRFKETSWENLYDVVKKQFNSLKPSEIAFITGNMVEAETLFLLKMICDDLNIKNIDASGGLKLDSNKRISYLFNTKIDDISKSDLCLLVGANPRFEASMVGLKLRKRYKKGDLPIASIGDIDDQTYKIENLGNEVKVLEEIISGKHPFSKKLQDAKNPIIIVGETILKREDSLAVQSLLSTLCNKFNVIREDWNGYNVLHQAASRVAAFDLGLSQNNSKNSEEIIEAAKNGEIKLLYIIGEDNLDLESIPSNCTIVYQGHHGDTSAHFANIIIPGAAYTEKNGTYLNMEGRVQRTKMAVNAPNLAKEDYKILCELIEHFGRLKAPKSINEIRNEMHKLAPHFAELNLIKPAKIEKFGEEGKVLNTEINSICENFFLTNAISRASKIMAECAKLFIENKQDKAA